MKKSDIYWQTYLNLEKEVIEVSKFIFITDEKTVIKNGVELVESCNTQLETFSPHIADLLVRCCVQIEAISKELYYENGGTKLRGENNILFDEDCLRLIDKKWETHNKKVLVVAPFFNLKREENLIIRPLNNAHKKQGTGWERAYQAVKHDRYYSLHKGTVKSLIHAMAALYLLNLYYRNDLWMVKYQDISKQDYSLGSSLFAVNAPVSNGLWYGNKPITSESPYVATYKKEVYEKIKSIQQKEDDSLYNYIQSLPELNEPEFLVQYKEACDKDSQGARGVNIITLLAKYILNKKIPKTLPIEERKNLLIGSEEWNCWINQHNKHLMPQEITEDNIQHEIDMTGIRWGWQIIKEHKRGGWLSLALNDELCEVRIPNMLDSPLQPDM